MRAFGNNDVSNGCPGSWIIIPAEGEEYCAVDCPPGYLRSSCIDQKYCTCLEPSIENGCPNGWVWVPKDGQSRCAMECPPQFMQYTGPRGEKICTDIVSQQQGTPVPTPSQSQLHPSISQSKVPPTAYASVSIPEMVKDPVFWVVAAVSAVASYMTLDVLS